MSSPNSKRSKLQAAKRVEFRTRWRLRFEGLLIGIILLFTNQLFVGILPGPKPYAEVNGLRVTQGNAAGCTVYQIMITADEPLDYFYLKIQFPKAITGYKAGFAQEGISRDSGVMSLAASEVGRNAKGQCDVIQSTTTARNIEAYSAGNIITLSDTKLASSGVIIAFVATSDSESTVNPPADFWSEGQIEYTRLGMPVRKRFPVNYKGITLAK